MQKVLWADGVNHVLAMASADILLFKPQGVVVFGPCNMIGSGSTQKQNQNLMMSAVISTISNSSLLFVDNPGALRY